MEQRTASNNQPFILHPYQIWNQLDAGQKGTLTIIYQLDSDIECQEDNRRKQEDSSRPSDDWRWIPFTAHYPQESTLLQDRLRIVGMEPGEAMIVFWGLEMRGLIRCLQDRWAADDRLFVRILFLGLRVVRDGRKTTKTGSG